MWATLLNSDWFRLLVAPLLAIAVTVVVRTVATPPDRSSERRRLKERLALGPDLLVFSIFTGLTLLAERARRLHDTTVSQTQLIKRTVVPADSKAARRAAEQLAHRIDQLQNEQITNFLVVMLLTCVAVGIALMIRRRGYMPPPTVRSKYPLADELDWLWGVTLPLFAGIASILFVWWSIA